MTPPDLGQMQRLRRFALQHKEASEPVVLDTATARGIASAILAMLGVMDRIWETFAGRKLTDEEKGLT